jgi:hypothetical protein
MRFVIRCQIDGVGVRHRPLQATSRTAAWSLAEALLGSSGIVLDVYST